MYSTYTNALPISSNIDKVIFMYKPEENQTRKRLLISNLQ